VVSQEPAAGSGPAASGLEAKVDAYLGPYVRTRNFSGAILIARVDRVLLEKGYGQANVELSAPATPETRFHIASVSKPFTAAAILLLEERGRLRVEDALSRFLPAYPGGERITLHHLLAHRSGVPNVNQLPGYEERKSQHWSLDEIIGWFKDRPLEFEPGSRFSYSNSNYNLLAAVVERVSGETYGDFLRRNVLAPAGLRDTDHDGNPATLVPGRAAGYVPVGLDGIENAPLIDWSIKTGNGSLYSTVGDLHRWVRALRAGKVLAPSSVAKMFTDHGDGVGYGWFLHAGQPASVSMSGRAPGFSASIEESPGDGLVAVVAANLYSSLTVTVAPDLMALARGESREPRVPAHPVTVPNDVLARNVGRYRFGQDFRFNPGATAEVRLAGGGLELVVSNGGGTTALLPVTEERFVDRLYGGTVTFPREAGGRVQRLLWNFGRDYEAQRTSHETSP
jgi:CubicO group peptidase (beta-lactamase class C family)